MKLLFIYAHPNEDSLAAAARDCAVQSAKTKGHEVRLIDLYATGFQPCLTAAEWQSYADPDAMGDDLDSHVDALLWAEGIIFIHPTWWSGMPALLKGMWDRIFMPRFAFHFWKRELNVALSLAHEQCRTSLETYLINTRFLVVINNVFWVA